MAATKEGKVTYKIYRALTYGVSPVLDLHLRFRRLRGREHPHRWTERLGRPSLPRPPGPLLWFHAVSLGEGMSTIPIIKHCIYQRPDLNVLMTTATVSAFEVIYKQLPNGVIYQFAPLDTPTAVGAFLDHWKPNAIIIIESELWPNLIMSASKNNIVLALLNARISAKAFKYFSGSVLLPLISLMLSKFSLIVPLVRIVQCIHILYYCNWCFVVDDIVLGHRAPCRLSTFNYYVQAPPCIINFSGDLKYVVEDFDVSEEELRSMEDLKLQLAHRQVWMASSIHRGEEEMMLGVHTVLTEMHPDMLTILVPRDPRHGREIAQELQKEGQNVALRSRHEKLVAGTTIYIVDTLGELRYLYGLTPIAVVGGSFFPGTAGHNISEAAAAGCAVLTGHHVGHFSHMVLEMQRLNPLSVLQVSGKVELEKVLKELFSDAKVLESRRMAAKQANDSLSRGVVANVWNLLNLHVFKRALC